ncbi:hypothetical protein [Devosia sp. CN2-171]|uniref:hypothetical protein n=1 Tax=Devosia sp. CN2-171 TaxID=3400909 RepID=UPI003BF8B5D9
MPKPKFPHKPAAPSVREKLGPALARSKGLSSTGGQMTDREIVEDILGKLSLPESIRQDLKKRHGL